VHKVDLYFCLIKNKGNCLLGVDQGHQWSVYGSPLLLLQRINIGDIVARLACRRVVGLYTENLFFYYLHWH